MREQHRVAFFVKILSKYVRDDILLRFVFLLLHKDNITSYCFVNFVSMIATTMQIILYFLNTSNWKRDKSNNLIYFLTL